MVLKMDDPSPPCNSCRVREYWINFKMRLNAKHLWWLLVLILPGGFLFMLLWLLVSGHLKGKLKDGKHKERPD